MSERWHYYMNWQRNPKKFLTRSNGLTKRWWSKFGSWKLPLRSHSKEVCIFSYLFTNRHSTACCIASYCLRTKDQLVTAEIQIYNTSVSWMKNNGIIIQEKRRHQKWTVTSSLITVLLCHCKILHAVWTMDFGRNHLCLHCLAERFWKNYSRKTWWSKNPRN